MAHILSLKDAIFASEDVNAKDQKVKQKLASRQNLKFSLISSNRNRLSCVPRYSFHSYLLLIRVTWVRIQSAFYHCLLIIELGGSRGLVVMGGDSFSKGHGFESRRRVLDGHDKFLHIFVVRIVMFV